MQIPMYIVKYFDPDCNQWFDGTPPMTYRNAAVARNFYAEAFSAKIVFAGVDKTPANATL
jgi:hypothetical protein